ncbi:MAG: cysteine methyltransferase [Verrucomicrobiales bacterium]|nr:cysteine methyltransferase [Verrucomicrobiales bacterium]|tara:strand:+ start:13086 stop:13556 length:471 start_codon:yes stop_codon:yes gene_type:complete
MAQTISTPLGKFHAHFSPRGLARLHFPGDTSATKNKTAPCTAAWTRQTRNALVDILKGKTPSKLPPLDLSCGTHFQQKLWHALLRIPAGKTRSYGELAVSLRRPNAARAIGQACGANPIPVIIPCHRVLATNGGLGGFSGGLGWKEKLLQIEGHMF